MADQQDSNEESIKQSSNHAKNSMAPIAGKPDSLTLSEMEIKDLPKPEEKPAGKSARNYQLSIVAVAILLLTGAIVVLSFFLITTGSRSQVGEVIPIIAIIVSVAISFGFLLSLVNKEPSLFFRILESFILLPKLFLLEPPRGKPSSDAAIPRRANYASESFFRSIKGRLAEKEAVSVDRLVNRSLTRLEAEISEVRRRGGINLAMGMSITLAGLGILGYAVYAAPSMHTSTTELVAYFFPRVSLALITEMFAYFFLRLYKLSMSETKYFQNEMTGAEARAISVLLASRQENPTLITSVAKSLMALDRNHVLEKGQTTVEIEQARIESEALRGIVGSVSQASPWRRRKVKTQSGSTEQ